MTITYLKWRDASYNGDERDESEMTLVDLQEVGWLVREDNESITLSMEHQDGATARRLWLSVPKVNVIERRDVDLDRAFPARKRRR
jgi:hypothetical protein